MRCKKHHPYQAGGGVCATCLHDRLLVLEAAQQQQQQQNAGDDAPSPSPPPGPAQQDPLPPPPEPHLAAFPRSVSPYVSRRKSDTTSAGGGGALRHHHHHHHPSLLFFRTPQVGPAYGISGGGGAFEEGDIGYEYEKRRARKFSVLATLFGHHHHRHRSEGKHQEHEEAAAAAAKERKTKHSWFAAIIPRRRRKHAPDAASSPQSAPLPTRRFPCRAGVVSNRGLSPERDSGDDESSSSPPADPPWRPSPSPMRRTPCRRRQTGSTMPSGFAVCLSPLVRPTPGRRHRAPGPVQPPDPGTEFRPSPLHSLSSVASVTRCRSRKLADGGRFW